MINVCYNKSAGVGVGGGLALGFQGTRVPVSLTRAKRADAKVGGEKETAFLINKLCTPLNEFG